MGAIARSPLHSRGSPRKRAKSELAASIPPSRWADKRVELLHYPSILGGPKKGGKIRNRLPHSCLLGGRTSARKCYITPASSVVPSKIGQIGIGYLTPVFSRGPEVSRITNAQLHSRGSPTRGTNVEMPTSPVPSRGPKSGRNCYATPTLSGGPQQGGPNGNSLAHLCLLGGPQVGRIGTSPLHSRSSPTRRTNSELATSPVPSRGPTSGRNCYVTPALSGCPSKRDKIKVGRLTPAFPGRGGAQGCRIAMTQLHCRGSPRQGRNSKLAASPVPSWGPTNAGNCYITLASLVVRNKGDKSELATSPPPSWGAHKWEE